MYSLRFIVDLYDTYLDDLRRVIEYQGKLRPGMNVLSDDVECELSYLLIRHLKPNSVVDIGANEGWSTSWLLHAVKDNGAGPLFRSV